MKRPKNLFVNLFLPLLVIIIFGANFIFLKNKHETKLLLRKIGLWEKHSSCFDVSFFGNLAFTADGPFGFSMYDIQNVQDIKLIDFYPTRRIARGIIVADSCIYISDDKAGLSVYHFTRENGIKTVNSYSTMGLAREIAMRDSLLFVSTFFCN